MKRGRYFENIDYCGPGESWLTALIPNTILGVSINHCCYLHDAGWAGEEPRYKSQDIKFRECILAKFDVRAALAKSWRTELRIRLVGFCVAWLYYYSVRLGSLQHRLKRKLKAVFK